MRYILLNRQTLILNFKNKFDFLRHSCIRRGFPEQHFLNMLTLYSPKADLLATWVREKQRERERERDRSDEREISAPSSRAEIIFRNFSRLRERERETRKLENRSFDKSVSSSSINHLVFKRIINKQSEERRLNLGIKHTNSSAREDGEDVYDAKWILKLKQTSSDVPRLFQTRSYRKVKTKRSLSVISVCKCPLSHVKLLLSFSLGIVYFKFERLFACYTSCVPVVWSEVNVTIHKVVQQRTRDSTLASVLFKVVSRREVRGRRAREDLFREIEWFVNP